MKIAMYIHVCIYVYNVYVLFANNPFVSTLLKQLKELSVYGLTGLLQVVR